MEDTIFTLRKNTRIETHSNELAVLRAVERMKRDMTYVLENEENSVPNTIRLIEDMELDREQYVITFPDSDIMEIRASDELGFVYALLFLSEHFLDIAPFWFWNDQKFDVKREIKIPIKEYKSQPMTVKFRGWFVNDEVLLHTWNIDGDSDRPWEMVFEALLRCGGNMVIPGTGKNAVKHRKLASAMGLWITGHHAEPLGAEMFSSVYPELEPSFKKYPDLFRGLWREALERQKDSKVVWNLGFRGQGDCPFWLNDPDYVTDEERGRLISSIIREQYDLVKEYDSNGICCTNLYGEIMELYKKEVLYFPNDVIKVWADNGYGKMVSRRQENHNPRIPSMPIAGVEKQGIYYHVSFYDLQAANHITLANNSPEFLKRELESVIKNQGTEYWIINCSNVKPHVYYLDFVAKLWRHGSLPVEEHLHQYESTYYDKTTTYPVSACFKRYFSQAVPYGKHEDEHVGEQFLNHTTRILVSSWMRNQEIKAEELTWAIPAETIEEQVKWYEAICKLGVDRYTALVEECHRAKDSLSSNAQAVFEDSILLHAKIYQHCYQGAKYFCEGFAFWKQGEYQKSFYMVGNAAEEYDRAYSELTSREHDKWSGFYQNECLTDLRLTAWTLKQLMSYIRNLEDGPHYYKWKREFLYSEEERKVMLILMMENHLENEELFLLMKERWDK